MIIDDLITTRTENDVLWLQRLAQLGIDGMTADELDQWLNGQDEPLFDVNGVQLLDVNGVELMVAGDTIYGAYNYVDLNRVGEAVDFLATLLTSLGYSVSVTAKQDWSMGDIPTATQMTAYLADIAALKSIVSVSPAAPASMDGLTYAGANAIEQILVNIYAIAQYYRNEVWYCGEAICGGQ